MPDDLNRKLAEWAGFKYNNYGVYEYEHKDTRIEDPYWTNPTGQKCKTYPHFPSSLDACLKWLAPGIDGYVIYTYGDEVRVSVSKDLESFTGADKHPAMAFCKAIEQLIDSRKGGVDGFSSC